MDNELQSVTLINREMKVVLSSIYERATKLKRLNLSRNKIEYLQDVEMRKMVHLTELTLSYNHLTQIPEGVGFLQNLRHLDISHNKITHLPSTICFLSSLEYLDLTKNHVSELPRNLGLLKQLSLIKASKNPMKNIPKEILQAPDHLLSYLRNLVQGSKICARMKLMFVGNGNIGKTSLVRALRRINMKRKIKFSPSFRARTSLQMNVDDQRNVATDGIGTNFLLFD